MFSASCFYDHVSINIPSSIILTSTTTKMFRSGVAREKAPWVTHTPEGSVLHPSPLIITVQPLTPEVFAPFGSVIEDPEYPHEPTRKTSYQQPVSANQGTARKYTNVSPIINRYDEAPSKLAPTLQMSYFACEPRDLTVLYPRRDPFYPEEREIDSAVPHGVFRLEVMERHPYTTQTFAPMGLADTITAAQTKGWPRDQDFGTGYVVIVAPTTKTAAGEEIPDIKRLCAFLANGRQAVTYGVGVWHSPMVVVGKEVVGFLVTQWANGVAGEDCQELYLGTQQLVGDDFVGIVVKGFEGHHKREEKL